jgi:enoyl-[acyl-carrier-protein] reductase (NADH)
MSPEAGNVVVYETSPLSRWVPCPELGPKGIRVHAISPGPLATRAASGIPEFDALLDKAKVKAPARSLVSIEDVGVATAFLMCVPG